MLLLLLFALYQVLTSICRVCIFCNAHEHDEGPYNSICFVVTLHIRRSSSNSTTVRMQENDAAKGWHVKHLLEELLEEPPEELLLELLLLLLLAEPIWSSPRSRMASTRAARSGLRMRNLLSHLVDILGRPRCVCAQILSKVAVLA